MGVVVPVRAISTVVASRLAAACTLCIKAGVSCATAGVPAIARRTRPRVTGPNLIPGLLQFIIIFLGGSHGNHRSRRCRKGSHGYGACCGAVVRRLQGQRPKAAPTRKNDFLVMNG